MKNWTWFSFIVSCLLGFCAGYSDLFLNLKDDGSRQLAFVFAQIAATMLGFLVAALAILASISSKNLLRRMQQSGHYLVMLKRFFFNAIAYAFSMVTAFVVILFEAYSSVPILVAFSAFCFASLLLADIGWRLWLVLKNLTDH